MARLGCELKPRPTVSEIGFLGAAMINPTACMRSASSALQSRSVALRAWVKYSRSGTLSENAPGIGRGHPQDNRPGEPRGLK